MGWLVTVGDGRQGWVHDSVTEVDPDIEHLDEVTAQDVLDRAADLLEEFGWCQGHAAMDEVGDPVMWARPDAVSFCLIGALNRATFDLGETAPVNILTEAADIKIIEWNDNPVRTKEAVVLALRAGLPQFRSAA